MNEEIQTQNKAGEGAAPAPGDPTAALIAELTALRTWKAEREVEEARRAQEARLAEQRKLIEQGELEKLVKKHAEELESERSKSAEAALRYKASERNRELTLALAGHPLVKGAAEQLTRLWADEFEVVEAGDGFRVRSRDLKSPGDWVAAQLASEEYAHFVRAEQRGGGGADRGHRAAPTPVALRGGAAPISLAEDLVARLHARQAEMGGFSPGMGLRPVRK